MYYGIPTYGEVEAEMARDKMDVLKTQEKSIELDELVKAKKIIADQAAKKLAEAKMATPISAPVVPQGYTDTTQPPKADQEKQILSNVVMGERPLITNAEGTPMPSFMTGTTTEAAQKEPGTPATVEQVPAWSSLPQDVKDQLTNAQTEDEYNKIMSDYQSSQQPQIQGYQGEQQAKPAVETQQQEVPPTPYQTMNTANLDLAKAHDDVESAYKTAELFKQNGLLLQYQKQLKLAADLENVRSEAQVRHITAAKGLLEISGQIAQGYLDSVERDPSPANREKSWSTAIMQLNKVGIPVDDLVNMNPAQRDQLAHQYADSAITGANKLKLELEYLKEAGRNKRAEASLELRQDLGEKRLRMSARNQEAIQLRFDRNMDFKERTFNENRLKTIVSQAQRDRSELDQQLTALNIRLSGIISGSIPLDSTGKKYTKETRMQEVADIQKDINRIKSQRDDLSDEIKSYELKFKDLPAAAKVKEGDKTTQEAAPTAETKKEEPAKAGETKPGAPTQGNVSDAKAAVKAIQVLPPDQRDVALSKIKANWEKAHPGFKFEDYVTA